jgi:hypothetical protein
MRRAINHYAVATKGWRWGPGTRGSGRERRERERPESSRPLLRKEESP